jgi:hypothetical protein
MFKPTIAVAALMLCSPVLAATDYPSANMHTLLPK